MIPINKGSECKSKNEAYPESEFNAVSKPDSEPRSRVETVHSKEKDEVCWCQVEIDMFEAKQDCESDATQQKPRLPACKNDREDENAVHEAVVLEVNMVDDEQTRRKKNRECSRVRCLLSGNGCTTNITNRILSYRTRARERSLPTGGGHRGVPIRSKLPLLFGSRQFANSNDQGF